MRRHGPPSFRFPSIAVCVLMLAGTACVRPLGPGSLKRELSAATGVRLEREMGVTVTRSGVWLARKILKWSDAGEDVPPLKGLHRVEVGIYEVVGLERGREQRERVDAGIFPEWEPMVRLHEDDGDVLVLLRRDEELIRQMLVVVAEEDEWVLVRLRGKLDRILEQSIAFAFDEAERPDLYDRTREERGLEPLEPAEPTTDEGPDYLEASLSSQE